MLVTAALFAVVATQTSVSAATVPLLVFVAAGTALSAADLVRYRLPDKLTFPTLQTLLALVGVLSVATDSIDHLFRGVGFMFLYGLLLLIPSLIVPAGLGLGDVKLALVLGLMLGWTSETSLDATRFMLTAWLLGLLLGIATGVFVALGRRVFGHDFIPDPEDFRRPGSPHLPVLKTAAPFGPALLLATFLVLLYAPAMFGVVTLLT